MENPSARTSISGFVYWITFALLLMSAIWKVNFSWSHGKAVLAFVDPPGVWIPLIGILLAPVPILLANVAQYLRSGATIWLVSIVAIQLLPDIVMQRGEFIQFDDVGSVARKAITFIIAFGAILGSYFFLIKNDELRQP